MVDRFNLPVFSQEQLSSMGDDELFSILKAHEDRVPLNVIEECVTRSDDFLPLLTEHFEDDRSWSIEADEGDFWALLHTVFILGLLDSKASEKALLDIFKLITINPDNNNLADWCAGYWPALCRNKSQDLFDQMRHVAADKSFDWYIRTHAIGCVFSNATRQNTDQVEEDLDWVAGMAADENEEAGFRVFLGHFLLDLPRERNREVFSKLLKLQETDDWYGKSFDQDHFERALDEGDNPEWLRFDNPWNFYDPEFIVSRQERWEREEKQRQARLNPVKTFVREETKVGRNDPCPCGSGKKYKKCCLH